MDFNLIHKAIAGNLARAPVDTSALGIAGSEDLIAGVAGKKIRLLQLVISSTAVSNFTLRSSTTALTGQIAADTKPVVWPLEPLGWVETAAGEALNLLNGPTAAGYDGLLMYVLVG